MDTKKLQLMKRAIYLLFIFALVLDHATTTIGLLSPEKPLVLRTYTSVNGTSAGFTIPDNQKIGVWVNPNIYEMNPVVTQIGLFWWTISDIVLVTSIILFIEGVLRLNLKYIELTPLMLVIPTLVRMYVGAINIIHLINYFNA